MNNKTYLGFKHNIVIIGFGSIGQAVLPLLFRHLEMKPHQVSIITKEEKGADVAHLYGVHFEINPLTKDNFQTILKQKLKAGDFLLNLSVDVSSTALIELCQTLDVLYLDTCIEPWPGRYTDASLPTALRSNYALRESALALRQMTQNKSTAIITHGANPGLVSHFVKEALLHIARDTKLDARQPNSKSEWAGLAKNLSIKSIHIAERDTQISNQTKIKNEFVNTWSVDGYISEGLQPAELGWGTHEKYWPYDGNEHDFGPKCAIYLNRPGASTRVRTWTPLAGPIHGFLITHGETISIADYLTVKQDDVIVYRPTVHYAYHPCDDAVLSIHEMAGREWQQQSQKRLLMDDVVDGVDELGVLLMGHEKGAYWFGSQLSIHETRKLVPYNNATSLQVAVSVLSGMIFAMSHPDLGILEPDELDFEFILKISKPYLGSVGGFYTDWTPLQNRASLFEEKIDLDDPWQFLNICVS